MERLSETEACRDLSAAITRNIPADTAAELLWNFRAAVRREAAQEIRRYPETQWWGQGENRDIYVSETDVVRDAADLIDPDTEG